MERSDTRPKNKFTNEKPCKFGNAQNWNPTRKLENFVTTARKEGTLRTGMQTKRQLQTQSTQCDRRRVRNNWRRIRRIRNKHTQN